MKKVLITGGAGYLGSKLSTALIYAGYKVTVIDNLTYSANSILHLFGNKNFEFIKGSVLNDDLLKKSLKKQDIIIPLAALVGAPLCEKNKSLAKKLNVGVIDKICKLSKKDQKIIYLTTNSGYGVGEKDKLCDENSILRPVSLYGRTKNEAENIVKKRGNQISLRLATVFGYSYRMRTDLLVNYMTLQMFKYRKIKIFEPNFRRNFIHIDDVVNAIIFIINNFKTMKNEVYNLGLSNANITKLQLANKIKFILKNGSKIKIIKNIKDPDQRDYYVSNKKIESKGFKAKISLDEGISELSKIFNIIELDNLKNNY